MSELRQRARATAAGEQEQQRQQPQAADSAQTVPAAQLLSAGVSADPAADALDASLRTPAASSNAAVDGDSDSEYIVCRVKRYKWAPPAGCENHVYEPHQGEGSQYLRDFILGVNDGIISTFLAVVSIVAGGGSNRTAQLGAISVAVAGAISMGLGEYLATKSQHHVNLGEYALEREHFKYHRDRELDQLRGFLLGVGLEGNLLEACVSQIGRSDAALMKMMQAFEFGGANESIERNPLTAMFTSGKLFLIGCVPTVLPFFWAPTAWDGLWCAGLCVGLMLFAVGAYKSRSTKGVWWYEGLENLLFGVVGAAVSFAVGRVFELLFGVDLPC